MASSTDRIEKTRPVARAARARVARDQRLEAVRQLVRGRVRRPFRRRVPALSGKSFRRPWTRKSRRARNRTRAYRFEFAGRSRRADAVVFLSMASVRGGFERRLLERALARWSRSVLEEAADGTKLTVTESGFDQIPLERRAKAFAANEGGWAAQMKLIEKYLAQHAQA